MYRCNHCGSKFDEFDIVNERHGFVTPPYEKIAVCPHCGIDNYEEIDEEDLEEE